MGHALEPFEIKRLDTIPAYEGIVVDERGDPLPLTSASSVTFHMRPSGVATAVVVAQASIVSAAQGRIAHQWQASHTASVGFYQGEFSIQWSDGGVFTVPRRGFAPIQVTPDIA